MLASAAALLGETLAWTVGMVVELERKGHTIPDAARASTLVGRSFKSEGGDVEGLRRLVAPPAQPPALPDPSVAAALSRLSAEIGTLNRKVAGLSQQGKSAPPTNQPPAQQGPTASVTPATLAVTGPQTPTPQTYASVALAAADKPAPTTKEKTKRPPPPPRTKAKLPTLVFTPAHYVPAANRPSDMDLLAQARTIIADFPTADKLSPLSARYNERGNIVLTFQEGTGVNAQLDTHRTAIGKRLLPSQPEPASHRVVPRSQLQISMVPVRNTPTSPAHRQEVLIQELKANPPLSRISFLDVAFTTPPERLLQTGNNALMNCPVRITFEDPKGELTKCLLAKPSIWLFGKRLRIQYRHPRPPFIQCTRCQALGHTDKGCKAQPHCGICDALHRTSDHRARCTDCAKESIAADRACPHPPLCHNCKGEHRATDPSCPLRRRYRQAPADDTPIDDDDEEI